MQLTELQVPNLFLDPQFPGIQKITLKLLKENKQKNKYYIKIQVYHLQQLQVEIWSYLNNCSNSIVWDENWMELLLC